MMMSTGSRRFLAARQPAWLLRGTASRSIFPAACRSPGGAHLPCTSLGGTITAGTRAGRLLPTRVSVGAMTVGLLCRMSASPGASAPLVSALGRARLGAGIFLPCGARHRRSRQVIHVLRVLIRPGDELLREYL